MGDIDCGCPRNNLCPGCINQALMWFGGMACSRGIAWAQDAARRRPGLLLARIIEYLAVNVAEHAVPVGQALQADRSAPSTVSSRD